MFHKFLAILLVGLCLLSLMGCSEDEVIVDPPPVERVAYVLNGLASTLSVINSDGTVANNVATVGAWANDMVLDESNSKMYVVNSGDNNVQVINLLDFNTEGLIDIGVGTNPYSITLIGNNRALVSKLNTSSIAIVDLMSKTVIDTIPVGTAPEGIAYKEGYAYVANSAYGFGEGSISVIDVANKVVITTIPVGINPQTVFFDSQGELNVICTGDYDYIRGIIYVIDITTNTVKTNFEIGGFPRDCILADNGTAYITATGGWPIDEPGYLMSFDTINETALNPENNPVLAKANLFGLGINPDTHKLWVCDFSEDKILEIEPSDGNISGSFNLGDGPQVIRFAEE